MINKPSHKGGQKGYIALISVLIVGAVAVSVSLSLLLLGLGATRTSLVILQSEQAMAVVNACAEEGLQNIASNFTYTGTGSLTIGSGTCTYTVVNNNGLRTVTATGTINGITRKVTVIQSTTTFIWQEVS